MRKVALFALAGLLVALPASAARTDEVVRVPIGFPVKSATSTTSIPADKPLSLLLAGTHRVSEAGPNGRTFEFDALYCFKGCEGGIVPSFNLRFAAQKQGNYSEHSLRSQLPGTQNPVYNPAHRYKVNFPGLVAGYGRLRFSVSVPEPQPAAGFVYKYSGGYNIEIVGAFTEEDAQPLRVNFIVSASGKPNLPLKGYPNKRTLVSSRVSGSGHATFTKKNALVLVATETKGSIVHEDTYSDGTKDTLTFGIVSGTRYYPESHRLALVLKLKESNDDACQTGFLISTTFGVLTLIPHEDVGPDGGTVIFFGLPKSKLTDQCRHAHGWVSSPSEHVRARILLAESKP